MDADPSSIRKLSAPRSPDSAPKRIRGKESGRAAARGFSVCWRGRTRTGCLTQRRREHRVRRRVKSSCCIVEGDDATRGFRWECECVDCRALTAFAVGEREDRDERGGQCICRKERPDLDRSIARCQRAIHVVAILRGDPFPGGVDRALKDCIQLPGVLHIRETEHTAARAAYDNRPVAEDPTQ